MTGGLNGWDGPEHHRQADEQKNVLRSPGMTGGLNGWDGPEDHRQAVEQKNILKSPGMTGGLNGWNGPEEHRQADEQNNVKKGCDRGCPKIFMPICDSNKKTHANKCLFKIAQCEAWQKGKSLTFAHQGSCKSAPVESDCLRLKAKAEIDNTKGWMGFHIPSCLSDGTYDPTQCHGSTGFCWCVEADGTVIEGTRVSLRGSSALDCSRFRDTAKPLMTKKNSKCLIC